MFYLEDAQWCQKSKNRSPEVFELGLFWRAELNIFKEIHFRHANIQLNNL